MNSTISRHRLAGNVKKSYFHALAGTRAPRQPMYRRRETKLVSFFLAHKPPPALSGFYQDLLTHSFLHSPLPMHGAHNISAFPRAPQDKNWLSPTENPRNRLYSAILLAECVLASRRFGNGRLCAQAEIRRIHVINIKKMPRHWPRHLKLLTFFFRQAEKKECPLYISP